MDKFIVERYVNLELVEEGMLKSVGEAEQYLDNYLVPRKLYSSWLFHTPSGEAKVFTSTILGQQIKLKAV